MTELRVSARRGVHGGTVTVEVSGELDVETAPEFETLACGYLMAGVRRVVVDMTGLSFADVAGLRALGVLRARAGDRGITVMTFGAPPQVRRLMAILTPRAPRPARAAFLPPAS